MRIIEDRRKVVKRSKYQGKSAPKMVDNRAVVAYKARMKKKSSITIISSESDDDVASQTRLRSKVVSCDQAKGSNEPRTSTDLEKKRIEAALKELLQTSDEDSDTEAELVIQEDRTYL